MDAAPGNGGSGGLSPRAQQLKQELLGEFSLTVDDVAGVLEVDRSTVYRYIQDGALAALKLGREYRLSEVDVKGFLQALIERERRRVTELRVKALAVEPSAPRAPAPDPPRLEPGPGPRGDWGELASAAAFMKTAAAAQASGHAQAHPAHLLLALLADDWYERWEPLFPTQGRMQDGMARQAVERLGVDVPALRTATAALLPPPDGAPGEGDVNRDRSPALAAVFGRAQEAKAALGRRWVGSDCLLLALYGVPEVAEALTVAGAGEEAVRAELRRMADALAAAAQPEEARFGELAHNIVRDACNRAWTRGDAAVQPEHLLLALTTADSAAVADGVARRALDQVHADVTALRAAAEARLGPATTSPEGRDLPQPAPSRTVVLGSEMPQPTPGLRTVVLERATAAARGLGHELVGSEHLLLGLYSIEELAEVLERGGAPHAAVRAAVRRLVPPGGPQARETTPMYGRYSERAQRVIEQAQQEARQRGTGYVPTEHLVLSLLRDEAGGGKGIARRALEELGVDVPALRERVDALLPAPRHAAGEPRGPMQFTPRSKAVIMEHAVAAARAMGHAYVGTEHLLLGVYDGSEDLARVLEEAGAVREGVEAETLRLMGGGGTAEPRLDHAARDALRAAEAEARRLGHAAILPGHVLLGLLSEEPAVRAAAARAALDRLQVDPAALRASVEVALPKARRPRTQGTAPLNPEAAAVVGKHAPAAARGAGSEVVGTGHLLVGLLAVPEVADLLRAAGAPEDALRVELSGPH